VAITLCGWCLLGVLRQGWLLELTDWGQLDILPLVRATWCQSGMPSTSAAVFHPLSGYRFGPTRFSVIPRAAVGKVSIRFVARQEPKAILRALQVRVCGCGKGCE
jgi:hypothetical protein